MLILASISVAAESTPTYVTHELGTLHEDDYEISAVSVNNIGQIAGYSVNYSRPDGNHAVMWDNGSVIDLGILPGGNYSAATAVNNAGQVVGRADQDEHEQAVLWSPSGGITNLGTWNAAAINDLGQAVGSAYVGIYRHSLLYSEATGLVDIGMPGGVNSRATGINNLGQIVGWSGDSSSQTTAWLRQSDGTVVSLGTLGRPQSWTTGINNSGQVVGYYYDTNKVPRPFIWSQVTGMLDLGISNGYADAINNFGQVSGTLQDADGETHGFVWSASGGITVLNGPSRYTKAYDINDAGWVVGKSWDVSSVYHAMLWQPVPEPSSILALIGGLTGLGGLALRRRRR